MPTLRQLLRTPRKKKERNLKATALQGCPHKKGVCLRVFTQSPKKPNSANRAVAKVRIRTGEYLTAAIGGEGHNLQEHSVVLIRGGRSKDLPAVQHHVVRGALDLGGVLQRRQGRSKYGTPRIKKG